VPAQLINIHEKRGVMLLLTWSGRSACATQLPHDATISLWLLLMLLLLSFLAVTTKHARNYDSRECSEGYYDNGADEDGYRLGRYCTSVSHWICTTQQFVNQAVETDLRVSSSQQASSQWRRNEFESERAHIQRRENFLSFPSTFVALQVQLVVFGERFREGQYSLVSLLFAVLLAVLPVLSHL